MRIPGRSRSLRVRVLTLVGAGVFAAAALLSLLSRSTLQSLERELQHDHERLAASLGREVSRAISHDMRLLSRAASESQEEVVAALRGVREFGRVASVAFVVDGNGTRTACEPTQECASLPDAAIALALDAARAQRPSMGHVLRGNDGRLRFIAVVPLRALPGHPAAAGISIDAADRRFLELLDASDIAPTLRASLRGAEGEILSDAHLAPPAGHTAAAAVPGTSWHVEVIDEGADPTLPITIFRRRSLWLAPTLAALATLLGWGIAQSVRQPLIGLTASAERIARGDLAKPIAEAMAAQGGDEIARLASALERMRQALAASIREIEEANEELEWRVGERTRDLAAANLRLEERERARQRLLRQVISAQEEERKRVARELHDETSQTLAALGISVELGRLEEVRRLVDRMHHDIHRLIVNLRPSVLDDLGLAAAIRWVTERHLVPAGVAVRCEIAELEQRLPPEIETATFRIVQEAVSNIARHAQAESVLVQGSLSHGQVTVEIEDDGVGFEMGEVVTNADSLRGVGLLGMRERVEILGGTLTIDSAAGSGTRVAFTIPVPM